MGKESFPIGSRDPWEVILFILGIRLKIFFKHFSFVCKNVHFRKFEDCNTIKF